LTICLSAIFWAADHDLGRKNRNSGRLGQVYISIRANSARGNSRR
jgi:hypothetical protein